MPIKPGPPMLSWQVAGAHYATPECLARLSAMLHWCSLFFLAMIKSWGPSSFIPSPLVFVMACYGLLIVQYLNIKNSSRNVALPLLLVFLRFSANGSAEMARGTELQRKFLEASRCVIVDVGPQVFVWRGRTSTLEDRRAAAVAAEVNGRAWQSPLHCGTSWRLKLALLWLITAADIRLAGFLPDASRPPSRAV